MRFQGKVALISAAGAGIDQLIVERVEVAVVVALAARDQRKRQDEHRQDADLRAAHRTKSSHISASYAPGSVKKPFGIAAPLGLRASLPRGMLPAWALS